MWDLTGSKEKRAYLQERFPQLTAESFANSRDVSFEQLVLKHTEGKGQNLHKHMINSRNTL